MELPVFQNIYISIGAQCTTAKLFDILQVKKESLPFDFMFSTPQFVYYVLKLLLIDKEEINYIVDTHFFVCDKRAIPMCQEEHHKLDDNGSVLVNSKYNVCFPHDTLTDRDKYIRRIERLKHIILDENNFLNFVYVSVSSPTCGNYTIDGVEPIQQLYEYIEKINSMLKEIRSNYKIIIFDTNKPSHIVPSDSLHTVIYDIEKKNEWLELLPELTEKCSSIFSCNKFYNKYD
jgi:hypothetical protein